MQVLVIVSVCEDEIGSGRKVTVSQLLIQLCNHGTQEEAQLPRIYQYHVIHR